MVFPMLAWPAELHEDHFKLLDETRLPEETVYVHITNYHQAAQAIRDMKTRAFGQLLTVFYSLVLTARQTEDLPGTIQQACTELKTSRPTFAFSRYTDMVSGWVDQSASPETLVDLILDYLEKIKTMRLARAQAAADLFEDGDRVLTHCNTSGELLLTARICREQGKELRFYATETRPYFQGRLTAWEMSRDGFEITLIPDNRAAGLMAEGHVTKVITGSDRVARNGDIVNKIGTSQLARLARLNNIPFLVYVQEPGDTAEGRDIEIEHRPAEEVTCFRGDKIYPEGTAAFYPAFDLTPSEFVYKLITFGRVLTPAELPGGWDVKQ